MEEGFICPDDQVCLDIDTWNGIVEEYDLAMDMTSDVSRTSDVQAIVDLSWELLFLHPWELIYIGLPMSVLAFYGLSIYAIFKWIQKRFS
jgi:hypothetical protein